MRWWSVTIAWMLAAGCAAQQTVNVAPGRSAVAGHVTARSHAEVLAKQARDEQYIPQYDRRGIVPEAGAIDYAHLREIFVGLAGVEANARTVHEIVFAQSGASRESLALARGDSLRIRNATSRPLTFFLAGTDSDAFQDIDRIPPGATRQVQVRIDGTLDLMTDEDRDLVSHLLVRDGLKAVEVASGGDFVFNDLAPGEYSLVIWHWRIGRIERPIRLQPGRVHRVDEILSVDRTVR